eukprot:gene3435-3661_t
MAEKVSLNSTRKEEKGTPRYDGEKLDSSRSLNSQRSNPATLGTERSLETFRSSMSTSRVQTALAALTAEKQALMSKLEAIDAALEGEEKKKLSKPRARK